MSAYDCPQHPYPSPLCHVQQARTFTGRVELRDGPDFGKVTGQWDEPDAGANLIAGCAFLLAAAMVAVTLWALLALWLVRA